MKIFSVDKDEELSSPIVSTENSRNYERRRQVMDYLREIENRNVRLIASTE